MTVADRILAALSQTVGPQCDDCLAVGAVLSRRQQANAECRFLAQQGKTNRDQGTCSVCGNQKLVNWLPGGATGATRPSVSSSQANPTATVVKQASQQAAPSGQTLSVLGYPFNHVGSINPDRDAAGKVARLLPHLQYSHAATAILHRYGAGPFCRFRVPSHLTHEGVYLITLGLQVLYAGKCDNLAVRFNMGYGQISPRNCYQGGQNTNCKVNNLILTDIEQGKRLDLWFYATSNPLSVERRLIAGLKPPWNGPR